MIQSVPSVLLYAQAVVLLQELQQNYQAGSIHSLQDLSGQLNEILNRFENSAGSPVLGYEPVVEGEPPLSSKMNRTWTNLQHDVNILQNQVDVLRSASVFTHNVVVAELLKAEKQNFTVDNKLKTLQLYSNSVDPSIVTFGDGFNSSDFFDQTFSAEEDRPTLLNGILHLGQLGALNNLSSSATVTVTDDSNGIAGNNQEIQDPSTSPRDPITNEPIYTFVAETNRAADFNAITDNAPNTWFEYEKCLVTADDRLKAGNLNFTYQTIDDTAEVDWAEGPSGGTLKLGLQFDLGSSQKANYISYIPYGLRDNANFPVFIREIQTSDNGTDWTSIIPQNVWVGTDPNLQAARTADNVITGTVVWPFGQRTVRFVRAYFEQPQAIDRPIGHIYYVTQDTSERRQGPIPPLSDPAKYSNPSFSVAGDFIQKREFFDGKRWAIGIRDFLVQQIQYQQRSILVTNPLRVGGIVDRVSLEAEIFVPTDFSTNQPWVEFFVSPDDGNNWYQISRIQDDYLGIPEVIAFNDPLPTEFHEPGVSYVNTGTTVDSLRLKIVLTRPDDIITSTPLVRSYKLKVKRR